MTTLIDEIKNNTYGRNTLTYKDPRYIKELFEALKTNYSITSLDLSYNDLREEEIIYLCETLKTNYTITSLDLSCNDLGEEEIRYLCEALKANYSITSLDLSYNHLTEKRN